MSGRRFADAGTRRKERPPTLLDRRDRTLDVNMEEDDDDDDYYSTVGGELGNM